MLILNKSYKWVPTVNLPGNLGGYHIYLKRTMMIAYLVAHTEERRLRVSVNRVLRRIFGPKRDDVRGEWRRLHNEEINDLYSPPNIIRMIKSRRMRWAGHVARVEDRRGAYRVLVGRAEGKRPLRRPSRRWEDIKIDLHEVRWGHGLDLSPSGKRQVAASCECCNEHSASIECGGFLG
jgi:hypothetical protein